MTDKIPEDEIAIHKGVQRTKFDVLNLMRRKIYILTWITSYSPNTAVLDLIAGITLGLTMIPQAIAYSSLAALPSQYGLYAAFMGSMVYVVFGTVKQVSIGPTSLMALLTVQYTMDKPIELVILLAFIAGIVELLMGLFNLGFLVDFISVPVTSAFTSATSLIIIGTQLKHIFGINFHTKNLMATIYGLCIRITSTRLGDLAVGCSGIVFLLLLRQLNNIPISKESKYGAVLKKALWYISISRNAIIVLISSVIAYNWNGPIPFRLSGTVEPGIPSFQLPSFTIEYNNQTLGFLENVQELGSAIILVPLVAVLANVAIAKSFSSGAVIDASQEMIALGLCNLLGSFFKSMPTCGAFTRSAVSQASGVQTPMAGIYSGTMTLLALSLLTPYFYFIPKATLAAVLICAVFFMIDFTIMKKLWVARKADFVVWFGCFVVCIFRGVEVGLLFGILISALQLLYMWSRPTMQVQIIEDKNYFRIRPDIGIFYPGIDYLRERVNRASNMLVTNKAAVIDCCYIHSLDYSSAKGINEISEDLRRIEQTLVLLNLNERLHKMIQPNTNLKFCNEEKYLDEFIVQEKVEVEISRL